MLYLMVVYGMDRCGQWCYTHAGSSWGAEVDIVSLVVYTMFFAIDWLVDVGKWGVAVVGG